MPIFKSVPIRDEVFAELKATLPSRVRNGRINMDKLMLTRHRYKCTAMHDNYGVETPRRCLGVRQANGEFERTCGEPCEFVMHPETGEKM